MQVPQPDFVAQKVGPAFYLTPCTERGVLYVAQHFVSLPDYSGDPVPFTFKTILDAIEGLRDSDLIVVYFPEHLARGVSAEEIVGAA